MIYTEKIVSNPHGARVVSLAHSISDNTRELAKAKGKPVGSCLWPCWTARREGLIEEIRSAGSGTRNLLAGSIYAARYETRTDASAGTGGTSPRGGGLGVVERRAVHDGYLTYLDGRELVSSDDATA